MNLEEQERLLLEAVAAVSDEDDVYASVAQVEEAVGSSEEWVRTGLHSLWQRDLLTLNASSPSTSDSGSGFQDTEEFRISAEGRAALSGSAE